MSRLFSLYLNPTQDLYYRLQDLHPGNVHRGTASQILAGKPVNAARACRALGGQVHVLGFEGQDQWKASARQLTSWGLGGTLWPLRGKARTCVVLTEKSGRQTVVNSSSALRVSPKAFRGLISKLPWRKGDWTLASGSLPLGLSFKHLEGLFKKAKKAGVRLALDQRGPGLKALFKLGPDLVQANRQEWRATLGEKTGSSAPAILSRALALGAQRALVLDGPQGAWFRGPEGAFRLRPPRLRAKGPIGAGDAFLGGTMARLQKGDSWPEALGWGAAAACANVMGEEACSFSLAEAKKYVGHCAVRRIGT